MFGMTRTGLAALTASAAAAAAVAVAATAGQRSRASDEVLARLRAEESTRSELMPTLSYLTEAIGPRLTNSPNFRRAAVWTRDRLAAWGLEHAHLEPWGPFGRGWSVERFSAEVVAPQEFPLVAMPEGWSPGTSGALVADVVYLDAKTDEELDKYRGTLKGKIVLAGAPRPLAPHFLPDATRYSAADMKAFASDRPFPPGNENFAPAPSAHEIDSRRFAARRIGFLVDEGAALLVQPSPMGDDGTLSVSAAAVPQAPGGRPARAWDPDARTVPQIIVAAEHYNRMVRMLQRGEKLRAAVQLSVRFDGGDLMSSHTIADIPGTDLADEIVMVGAHLDSWHAGTGATDNGAGVAVAMEAMRLLEALKLRPRRTVRIALWGGEEVSGGARSYVDAHIARLDRSGQIVPGPDYDKYSAYFNIDAGTGRIRGVFLAGNAALRPIFQPWLAPLAPLGVTTLTLNGDWGSDFAWFDRVGIPIVSFIQDEIEYDTRTHHSNEDVLDRILPADLRQAAVVMADFVYRTAMRDDKLPRKPRK